MKFVFQGARLKIVRTMKLHIAADLLPSITSARTNIFPWDQKQLIDIGLLYQKQPKQCTYRIIFGGIDVIPF